MQTETVDRAEVTEALAALRQGLARLCERVAALEAAAGVKPRPPALSPGQEGEMGAAPAPDAPGLSEELVLVLSAAVAAFLGKKPHIRQIRLLGAAAWAQQGRVTIQASHNLAVRHG